MKSNKQRRQELREARAQRAEKKQQARQAWLKRRSRDSLPEGVIAVDQSRLAPTNSYSLPPKFYVDRPFVCRDCGAEEVWTAQQQQWWCEVAKGSVWSTAIRCRACRKIERDRKVEARRIYLEGIAKKLERRSDQP